MSGGANAKYEYHLPNCKQLLYDLSEGKVKIWNAYSMNDFARKSIYVNAAQNFYLYPQTIIGSADGIHKPITQCYHCIVNSGNTIDMEKFKSGDDYEFTYTIGTTSKTIRLQDLNGDKNNIRKAYFTAMGREKKVLYKSSDYLEKLHLY